MAQAPQSHSWHTFPKGTRVLDTVSGMDGDVIHTHIVHAVEPAAVKPGEGNGGRLIPLPNPVVHETVIVTLEDGTIVERSPRVLVAL
jgi:hypothetical protein